MKKKKLDPRATIRELEAMPKLARGPSRHPAPPLTEILQAFFPSRRGGHNACVSNPVDVRALSKDERRILELLCELDPDGWTYAHAGLPQSIGARRRLVGLDPTSVIDERWRDLKTALDEYGRKFANKSNAPRIEAWIAEKYFDASPEEWLEIWTQVAGRAYGYMATWDRPLPRAAAAVSPKARRVWAEKWAAEIMTSLDGDAMDVRLYTISLGKKPIYEMWTFLVDNGTVFPLGSHVPSGVHMIQGDFRVEDKRAESKTLADELQRDVPF
jgi:hypothetical protein